MRLLILSNLGQALQLFTFIKVYFHSSRKFYRFSLPFLHFLTIAIVLPGPILCLAANYDLASVLPLIPNKPYVTSNHGGELGNQLFQAAAGISLAFDNGAQYIYKKDIYPQILGKFYQKLPANIKFHYANKHKDRNHAESFYPIPYKDNMEIHGYWLSYKYFDHNKNLICSAFAPEPLLLKNLQTKYREILAEPIKVGLHIRTFLRDRWKMSFEEFHKKAPAPDLTYVKKAMQLFPDDALFIICSDDVSYAKKMLSTLNKRLFFACDSLINDFYLLTLCNHIIIANSSFSWWAAYLNQNKNKLVIAPVPFRYNTSLNYREVDLYPPDWILIERGDYKIENDMRNR